MGAKSSKRTKNVQTPEITEMSTDAAATDAEGDLAIQKKNDRREVANKRGDRKEDTASTLAPTGATGTEKEAEAAVDDDVIALSIVGLDGSECCIRLRPKDTIDELKAGVQRELGVATYLQNLYVDHHEGPLKGEITVGHYNLKEEDQVLLMVLPAGQYRWNPKCGLARTGVVKIYNECKCAEKLCVDEQHCLIVGGAALCEGEHTISFRYSHKYAVVKSDVHHFGVVREEGMAAWSQDQFSVYTKTGWSIRSQYGDLYGVGKRGVNDAGEILAGDTITLRLNLPSPTQKKKTKVTKGTLSFFINGRPHGPGYDNIQAPVQFAVFLGGGGPPKATSIEIVESPSMEC